MRSITGGSDLLFGPGPNVGLLEDGVEGEGVTEEEDGVDVVEAG